MYKIKDYLLIAVYVVFLILIISPIQYAASCEPEEYPPPPEIIWPLNESQAVPIDTTIIIKDFKLPSKNPPKLNIAIADSSGGKVEFDNKRIQSRRSVYNYEAGLIMVKPEQNLQPLENYTLSVNAEEGFEGPINQSITFSTGAADVLITAPEKINVSYYISEPGYYLSNCQTSVWDKATSLVFMNSNIEGYPVILVLESNLLKDVAVFHSSIEKRDLAVLLLPNEKGQNQCFNLSAYSMSGEKFFEKKLCKPTRCVKGEYLSKDEVEKQYKKHGAFGFSMIEFPESEKKLPNYCTLYPPLCREYWNSVPEDSCRDVN